MCLTNWPGLSSLCSGQIVRIAYGFRTLKSLYFDSGYAWHMYYTQDNYYILCTSLACIMYKICCKIIVQLHLSEFFMRKKNSNTEIWTHDLLTYISSCLSRDFHLSNYTLNHNSRHLPVLLGTLELSPKQLISALATSPRVCTANRVGLQLLHL